MSLTIGGGENIMYHDIIVESDVYYWLLRVGRILRTEANKDGSFTETINYLKEIMEKQ